VLSPAKLCAAPPVRLIFPCAIGATLQQARRTGYGSTRVPLWNRFLGSTALDSYVGSRKGVVMFRTVVFVFVGLLSSPALGAPALKDLIGNCAALAAQQRLGCLLSVSSSLTQGGKKKLSKGDQTVLVDAVAATLDEISDPKVKFGNMPILSRFPPDPRLQKKVDALWGEAIESCAQAAGPGALSCLTELNAVVKANKKEFSRQQEKREIEIGVQALAVLPATSPEDHTRRVASAQQLVAMFPKEKRFETALAEYKAAMDAADLAAQASWVYQDKEDPMAREWNRWFDICRPALSKWESAGAPTTKDDVRALSDMHTQFQTAIRGAIHRPGITIDRLKRLTELVNQHCGLVKHSIFVPWLWTGLLPTPCSSEGAHRCPDGMTCIIKAGYETLAECKIAD